MANRVNIGPGYEVENDDGETVEKHRHWIEVSSSLMSEVTARSMETGESPQDVLGKFVTGEYELSDE